MYQYMYFEMNFNFEILRVDCNKGYLSMTVTALTGAGIQFSSQQPMRCTGTCI